MFTAKQLKERMNETQFRPFRIKMSNGELYDIKNHDDAFVLILIFQESNRALGILNPASLFQRLRTTAITS